MPTQRERFDAALKRRQRAQTRRERFEQAVKSREVAEPIPGPAPKRVLENVGGVFGGAPVSVERGEVPKIIKESILPITGGVIGAAVAGLPGEVALSATGEALNQLFGITPKSLAQIGLAAGGPVAARGLTKIVGGVARRLPGAAAGLQEEAIEEIGGIVKRIVPERATPSSVLFNELDEINPFIRTSRTIKALDKAIDDLTKVSKGVVKRALLRRLTSLRDQIGAAGKIGPDLQEIGRNGLDFQSFRANLTDIGGLQGAASRAGKSDVEGTLKFINKALREDLEAAGKRLTGTAGKRLKEANLAFGREKFQESLQNEITKNIDPPRQVDGLIKIKIKPIIKQLERGKPFDISRKVLKGEVDDIVRTLKDINVATPDLPRIRGRVIGSGLFALRGSAGFGMGMILTKDPATASVFASAAVIVPEFISRALTTKVGRKLIRLAVSKKTPLTIQGIAATFQAVRNIDEFQPVIDIMDNVIQEKLQESIDVGKLIEPSAPFRRPVEPVIRQAP